MESVMIFLDLANVEAGARPYGGFDYGHFRNYLGEGRFIKESYCYVPIDPRRIQERALMLESLWQQGWFVHDKIGKFAGDTYKCNFDVEIAMDMMRMAQQIKPDIMVLCSGDEDFLPVVAELRRMGIRVEVAAFEANAANRLRRQASGFISLDVYMREAFSEQMIEEAEAVEANDGRPWSDEQNCDADDELTDDRIRPRREKDQDADVVLDIDPNISDEIPVEDQRG